MELATIKANRRDKIGTKYTRRMRAEGLLPAIIYGHGETPESISMPAHEVGVDLQHGARVLNVELEGQATQYLIKAIQYDHLGISPIHMDLMRVNLDEKVTVLVGIEVRGTAKGLSDGGVLEQHLANIEVECLVIDIPEVLRPSVKALGVGESLLVSDLELPVGVVAKTDAKERVVSVSLLVEEEAEADADAEAGAEGTQPEIIGRVKKDEDAAKSDS